MSLRDAVPGETVIITTTIDWRRNGNFYVKAGTHGRFIRWDASLGLAIIAIHGQSKKLMTDDCYARRLHPLEALADAGSD